MSPALTSFKHLPAQTFDSLNAKRRKAGAAAAVMFAHRPVGRALLFKHLCWMTWSSSYWGLMKYWNTPFKLGGSVILLGMPPRFQFKLRSCFWSEALVTSALPTQAHRKNRLLLRKDVTGRQVETGNAKLKTFCTWICCPGTLLHQRWSFGD